MKQTFKFLTLLIVISILSAGTTTIAAEKVEKYHKAWLTSNVQTLDISSKFGEIKINNEVGDSVTIDVTVTVEAANEKSTYELLEKIEVAFSKNGSTAKALTTIANDFKSQKKFSIDYTVNIPSDKNLKITNKYGNTIINQLNANGDFDIKYGNLTASELSAPGNEYINILLSYGNSNIGLASNIKAVINYSPINIGQVNKLQFESKYSVINAEEAGYVIANSKYDKLNFEELKSLEATTKYSHISIEELSKSLKIESGYGSIKVAEIHPDFEFVSITNSYGQISLGLEGASYSIDANCEYCGISYPEDNYSGDKIKEKHTQILKGKVGSDGSSSVMLKSRYGEIKLKN